MNFRGFLLINLFLDLMLHYCFHLCLGSANDTITSAQFIRDPETLSSNSNDFKLGFFSPQNSTNRYVGIWYLSEANVIWVANRNQGLNDTSGIFRISEDGNLVVLNGQNKSIWSSNVPNIVTTTTNSTAKLLDTGNLVLLHDNTGETIWESFQNPSDFLVPKMKLSSNKITGHKVKITSWKTPSDPSIGDYSASLERPNAPDVFLWFNGTRPYSRTGPWNGRVFMGSPTMSAGYLYGWRVENEEDGTVYLTYNFANDSAFGVIGLSPQGQLWMTWWNQKWEVLREVLNGTYCDRYGICGIFGSCNWHNSPICSCLRGYEPRNGEEWNRQNWTSGCVRRRPLKCEEGGELDKEDGFVKLEGVKVPDFVIRSTATEGNCRAECSENCSCVAYGYDLNGIGCMHWSGDLIDIQKFSSGGVDLYIRVANAELEKNSHKRTIIAVTVTVGMLALGACGYLLWKLTARYTGETHSEERMIQYKKQVKLDELPLFDFEVITTATNNFHSTNMLGHGGFGSVYKGQLQDGQQIAVKRLSQSSKQGQEEFMNEVLVISKLQHRNLVRLLGCCIQQDEKILIYEYMPNKSLDAILFDPNKRKELDWDQRFKIIEGISRGLLYLHRDSRLKIIHRDLKPSNILLDGELNPKISDFGMARIFGGREDEANTRRVVGTYGYMSPEYVMQGLFSEKSDVFSFGVLLLEIVSGRSNTRFYNIEESQSFLGYAWKLWKEDSYVHFIDPELSHQDSSKDILRCIHIGLLCVQELARDRPNMASVVSMLSSETVNLRTPREPPYVQNQTRSNSEYASGTQGSYTANNVSITNITGR